jgi:hypothetical protein
MYGPGIFSEEVIKTIEAKLNEYLRAENLPLFAQPLPMPNADFKPDMAAPADYRFDFEIGIKPEFNVDLGKVKAPYYRINVTEEMVNMISASRAYQNNVETMNAAKTMLLKTLTRQAASAFFIMIWAKLLSN